jgi:hypothetical protein
MFGEETAPNPIAKYWLQVVVVVVVFITPGRTDLIGPMATLNCSRIPAFHPIYTKESPTAVPNISALAPLA